MRALRSIRGGERVQKPRNWLIKIAHNECRRVLSVRSRRAEVELNDIATEPAEPGKAEELRRALGQLAPKQREALVLRELEGRSYAEIAESLDLTGSAVETLIFRARRAVREQLETALTCEEAIELITADAAADQDRERLRAHTRACAECATLERQARGRKGALRRLASSLGFPWFGKVAAVALTVSAAATHDGCAARPAAQAEAASACAAAGGHACGRPACIGAFDTACGVEPGSPPCRTPGQPRTCRAGEGGGSAYARSRRRFSADRRRRCLVDAACGTDSLGSEPRADGGTHRARLHAEGQRRAHHRDASAHGSSWHRARTCPSCHRAPRCSCRAGGHRRPTGREHRHRASRAGDAARHERSLDGDDPAAGCSSGRACPDGPRWPARQEVREL